MLMVRNSFASAGDVRDVGLIPGSRRSPGGGHGNPFQYSFLEDPMDRGAWWARVHRVTQSWIRLKRLSMDACMSDLWMSKIIDSWMVYILRAEDLKKKKKRFWHISRGELEPRHWESSFFVDDAELRTVKDEQRERLAPNRALISRQSHLSCQFLFLVSLREKLHSLIWYLVRRWTIVVYQVNVT